ncbi:unnamed protein product [Acanthosepion pharaonis]|uniref:Uncharacterized protein n=1 Tax=Acanthosepion pharaonis TaxID=158019 RepID=A0A812DW25_ACAPH|nr:unnamed protein product [Sepia pharaonis]
MSQSAVAMMDSCPHPFSYNSLPNFLSPLPYLPSPYSRLLTIILPIKSFILGLPFPRIQHRFSLLTVSQLFILKKQNNKKKKKLVHFSFLFLSFSFFIFFLLSFFLFFFLYHLPPPRLAIPGSRSLSFDLFPFQCFLLILGAHLLVSCAISSTSLSIDLHVYLPIDTRNTPKWVMPFSPPLSLSLSFSPSLSPLSLTLSFLLPLSPPSLSPSFSSPFSLPPLFLSPSPSLPPLSPLSLLP